MKMTTSITRNCEIAGMKTKISYDWMLGLIVFTCIEDLTIQGEFYLNRPFASKEPAAFLLEIEVMNYLEHSKEERVAHYPQTPSLTGFGISV